MEQDVACCVQAMAQAPISDRTTFRIDSLSRCAATAERKPLSTQMNAGLIVGGPLQFVGEEDIVPARATYDAWYVRLARG